MPFEQITLEVRDQVATVTLDRPEKLNAWTPVMGAELTRAFRQIDRDPAVRVAAIAASGTTPCRPTQRPGTISAATGRTCWANLL